MPHSISLIKNETPYCFSAIMERDADKDDTWGAEHFIITYLFADGIATYFQLFVKEYAKAPWLFLLQDHKSHNYDSFGAGGILDSIIQKSKCYPTFVICASNSKIWSGYKHISKASPIFEPDRSDKRELYIWAAAKSVNCSIEIREVGQNRHMGRFDIIVHHTNGTESNVKFATARRKFCYLLLLLIISNKNSAQGLMPRFFCYGRERIVSLARTCQFANGEGEGEWIDEFIYERRYDNETKKWYLTYNSTTYSNEARRSSEGFQDKCCDEEKELFNIKMTGGRNSITSIAVSPKQIVVPASLVAYTKDLPTREFLKAYNPVMNRPEDIAMAKKYKMIIRN